MTDRQSAPSPRPRSEKPGHLRALRLKAVAAGAALALVVSVGVSVQAGGTGTAPTPAELASSYITAIGTANAALTKADAQLKALTMTATPAQVNAIVAPLGPALKPLEALVASTKTPVTSQPPVTVAPAVHLVCGANLILNPGAELTTPSGASKYWTVTRGPFSVDSYTSGDDLSLTTPGPPDRGQNYFWGGADPNETAGSAYQDVPLTAAAAAIKSGKVSANLGGWLGGYQDQADNAVLTVNFLGAGNAVLTTLSIGPVTPGQRHNITELLHLIATTTVPAGTSSARITLTFNWAAGGDNDGLADNLSLVLCQLKPVPAAR